jgi:hypothetical protein
MSIILSRKSGAVGGFSIASLPEITSLDGTEEFPLNEGGGLTRKITAANMAAYFGGDPVFDLFGTPDTAFEFDTSSLTGLTALSTTPDVEDADTTVPGHYFLRDDGGTNLVGRYIASPSTPFTAMVKITGAKLLANYNQAGIFVGASTPGLMETVTLGWHDVKRIREDRWNSPTSYDSTPLTGLLVYETLPAYLAIRVQSTTDIDTLYSASGYVWTPLLTARNPSITIGSVGLHLNAQGGGDAAVAFDWFRVWETALSFPGVSD